MIGLCFYVFIRLQNDASNDCAGEYKRNLVDIWAGPKKVGSSEEFVFYCNHKYSKAFW